MFGHESVSVPHLCALLSDFIIRVIYCSLSLLCLVACACVERFSFYFDSVKAASCPLLHYLPEITGHMVRM